MRTSTASTYLALATALTACGANSARTEPAIYSSGSVSYGASSGSSDAVYAVRAAPEAPATRGVERDSVAVSESTAAPTATGASMAPARAQSVAGGAPMNSAPVAMDMVAPVMPTTTTVTTTTTVQMQIPTVIEQQQPMVGLLTAATVSDHDRRNPFLEYLGRHPGERSMLRLDMARRVRFRVIDGQGQPVNDAAISVSGSGAQVMGRSHADGLWDFYPSLYGAQVGGTMAVTVQSQAGAAQATVEVPFGGDGQDVTVRLNGGGPGAPRVLDLGFAIDVTGSMGDELAYIHSELSNIVQRVQASVPGTTVRVGATFYRDRTDPVVVQQIPFTSNVAGFVQMMGTVHASGGGDYPEDMSAGLDTAMRRMQWSQGNAVRVLVLVADAPPQHYNDTQYTYREAMFDAAARGIRVLPVAASGADRSVEYLFRAMGAATGAPYVYLTDESGVGAPHMEAATDRVAVERFNGLLTRLIVSDLNGRGMHELIRDQQ